jgi:hypothetical protein
VRVEEIIADAPEVLGAGLTIRSKCLRHREGSDPMPPPVPRNGDEQQRDAVRQLLTFPSALGGQ